MILLLAACTPSQDQSTNNGLSKLLTAHKWRYTYHDDGETLKLDYDWLLQLKADGTWAMDMENSVNDDSVSHTLKGTWELDETTLTVVMKDDEISEFNSTQVLEFADDLTDEKIEKDGLETMMTTFPDYQSDNVLSNQNTGKWYVSDKYFCFFTFLFTAE